MQHLGGVWADTLGWTVVLAGLAAFGGLLVLVDRRRRARRRREIADAAPRIGRVREWDVVMHRATRELARGPKVEELQADATVTIQAAEHAYNRLVIDCAHLCKMSTTPTFEPARALEAEPQTPPPEREPLAA